MAWQSTHKEQSKDKILRSAAMLFTHYGFEKISIDQVMEKAELTRGAFYSHFSSKSDLYAQAISKAVQVAQQRKPDSAVKLTEYAQYYLSPEHRDDILKQPCPLAFLVSDINQQNEQVKSTYTKMLQRFINLAEQSITDRQQALQSIALMIGGLAIARALDETTLSDELLAACQAGVSTLAEA